MKDDSLIEKFISMFDGITFNTICKPIKKNKVSNRSLSTTEKDLNKMLAKAKKDLSKAKKLFKLNKISSEELFEWEYRVSEIKQEIDKLEEDSNDDI